MLRRLAAFGLILAAALSAAAPARAFTSCSGLTIGVPANFATISAAVASIPQVLPGAVCINIGNNAVYAEQVTVRNFINNGSSITIQAIPGFFPSVQPPALSTAAFVIANASVSILGVDVAATQAVPYGVLVSSTDVSLSSVNIAAAGQGAYVAGLAISSWTTVSYSSVSTQSGTAVRITGSRNAISYSTAAASAVSANGLQIIGGASNTVTASFVWGAAFGAYLEAGSNYNAISLSTMLANNWAGLYVGESASNTATQSSMQGGNYGAWINNGSSYTAVSLSTMIATSGYGLHLNAGASSNTVTRSYMRGFNNGANVEAGSSFNVISLSTMVGQTFYGLRLAGASSNTVSQSWIDGSSIGAWIFAGSDYNKVSLTTMTSIGGSGLKIEGSDWNAVTQSHMQSPNYGLNVDVGADRNTVSGSTMVATNDTGLFVGGGAFNLFTGGFMRGANAGARLDSTTDNIISFSTMIGGAWASFTATPGADSNTVTNSFMTGVATGAWLAAGSSRTTIRFSTLSVAGLGSSALYIVGSDSNTVLNSFVFSQAGHAAFLHSGSESNEIGRSTAVSIAANYYALHMLGAAGNTISSSVFTNAFSSAALLAPGSHANLIFRSTMTGGSQAGTFDGGSGLVLLDVSSNTIIDSVMGGGAGGSGAMQSPGGHGLYISGGSSNTVTRGIMSGGGGGTGSNGGNLGGGVGGANGGAQSWGGNGVYLFATTSNTISQSLLAGGGGGNGAAIADPRGHGLFVYGSSFNVVNQSVLAGGGGGGGGPGAGGGGGGSLFQGGGGGAGSGAGCCQGAAGANGLFIGAGSGWNSFYSDFMYGGGGGGASSVSPAGAGGHGLAIASSTGNVVVGAFLAAGGGGGGKSGGVGGAGGSASGGGAGGAGAGGGGQASGNGGRGASLISGAQSNSVVSSTMAGGGFGTGGVPNGLAGEGLYIGQSSANAVSQSYMTGPAAAAQLDFGADFNALSFSTVAANAANSYALQLNSARSNTIQSAVVRNPAGSGIGLLALSDSNSIKQSTVAANQAGGYAVRVLNSDSVVVTGSYLEQASGTALFMESGSDLANISFSTIVSNSADRPAVLFQNVWSDTLTNSFVYNPFGTGFVMDSGSAYNAVVFSTIAVNSAVSTNYAYRGNYSSTNTIQLSYLQGPTAVYIAGSTGTVIDSSVLVATGNTGTALNFSTGNINMALTWSTLRGGPSGRSLNIGLSNSGVVSVGSVTMTAATRALEVWTQTPNFTLAVDSVNFRSLSPGATAIYFTGGTHFSTITLASFEDASVGANVGGASLDPASSIVMRAHYGARAGSAYENDPNNVVHWQAGPQPGCAVTKNVGLGQDYPTMNSALAALPQTLTGHSCVVVRDTMTYTEQVTVEGFTNNGSSITIMADPAFVSSGPLVNATGTAGFIVKNASVNISGFAIRAFAGVQYGILASSANVRISSVSVYDTMGFMNTAGVSLSSYSSVSNSSMTLMNCSGVRFEGSFSTVSDSSMTNNSGQYSLMFNGASSNTVTRSFVANASGGGAAFFGASGNAIVQSTVTGNNATEGIYLNASDSNTITGSYVGTLNGVAVRIVAGSHHNAVRFSTVAANGSGYGLYIDASSWNVVSDGFMLNTTGVAAFLFNAEWNTVQRSTMTGMLSGGFIDAAALRVYGSSRNSLVSDHIQSVAGYGAYFENGATANAVSGSTFASMGTNAGIRLAFSSSNTFTTSRISSLGNGMEIVGGSNYNEIGLSTLTAVNLSYAALWMDNSDSNTVTGSYLSNPLDNGLRLSGGADFNALRQSTVAAGGLGGFAVDITTSSSNAVTGSRLTSSIGTALFVHNFARGNMISASTITSAAPGYPAVFLASSELDQLSSCYIQGSTAVVISGSTGTFIGSSSLVATAGNGSALAVQSLTGNVFLASSTLRGGTSGRGLYLEGGNGIVAVGSVTVTGSARGLEISTQSAGFSLAVDSVTFRGLSAGATAIHFLGGTFFSSVTLANFEDATIGANVSAAALDQASRVSMFAHYGVRTSTKYENDPSGVVFWQAGPYPGCVVTNNVGAGQPYATIQAAVNALPASLTGHSCVVIRDGAVYGEQVTVANFVNNGSSITIMGDPASSTMTPRVVPPMFASAGFNILNSSVNLAGIEVRSGPGGGLSYGVFVSSPYVTIASVTVDDAGASIGVAGIALSSWTTVSYASVSVNNAYAFLLSGSRGSSLSYSTGTSSSAGGKAVIYAVEASSNSFTAVTAFNASAPGSAAGVRFDFSHYNQVVRSSFTSNTAGGAAFHLYASSHNSISGSYMAAPGSYGLRLEAANYNDVSQSTAGSSALGGGALELDNSSSNTATGVFASNASGYGAVLNGGSNNTLSLSTFNAVNQYGLYLFNTSSNAISASYASNAGGAALYLSASSSNTVTASVVAGNAASYGLTVENSRYNRFFGVDATGARLDVNADYNFISGSTFTRSDPGPGGFALFLPQASSNTITRSRITNPVGVALGIVSAGFSNYDNISESTITTNSGSAAMNISGWGHGLTGVYASNGNGYAVQLENTRFVSVAQSTIVNNSAGSAALYLKNSSTASIAGSVIANAGGDGVYIESTADWNAIERSVVRGAASGVRIASVSGLSIAFSTVIGGSGIGTAGIHASGTPFVGITGSYVEGSTGVYLGGSSSGAVNSNLIAGTGAQGSGLWLTGGTGFSMSSNTVLGGGIAGVALSQAGGTIVLSTNTIIARGATNGIAAINLNIYTLWITSNTILPTLSAAATTYGVFLQNLPSGATVQNNAIYFRTSGSAFAGTGSGAYGLYAAGSSGLRIDHNRISNPSKILSGNYIGAALDGLSNAIFKFNDLYSTGGSLTSFNLLKLVNSPNAVVRGNILSSSMTATTNRLIVVDAASQAGFSSDYNTFFSSNSSYTGVWGGSAVSLLANWISVTGRDANTLTGNPLWINPAGEDFHPLSRGGRWNGTVFVDDGVSGPGLDRADPAEAVGDEQAPNGARANQGSYGGTAEGSRTVLPCPTTLYVRQSGDADATRVQDGINALPNPLTSHSCIVIGDSAVYPERVSIEGFTNNGSSITIMADPSLIVRPTVANGFLIRNASVSVTGIDIAPTIAIAAGVAASSANITITSVSVSDPLSRISQAVVTLSSRSVLSNAFLTTNASINGVEFTGELALIANSTVSTNGAGNALYANGADSNTVTFSYLTNGGGPGAVLSGGADSNVISFSTIVGGVASPGALWILNSASNTAASVFVYAQGGNAFRVDGDSHYNKVARSTASAAGGAYALYLDASSNTVTDSFFRNGSGGAAYIDINADFNTISLSTFSASSAGSAALFMTGAESNTVTGCAISNTGGGPGLRVNGSSNGNFIIGCAASNTSVTDPALYLKDSSSNTITGGLFSNPFGIAALVDGGGYNRLSQSTVASAASGSRALVLFNTQYNALSRTLVSNPAGEVVRVHGGAAYNTISFSTMTGDDNAAVSAVIFNGASSNTIWNSYIQGSTAVIVNASTGTTINASVIVATATSGVGVALQGASVNLSLSSNTFMNGAEGGGVFLDAGNMGAIALSTNTFHGGRAGLSAYGQSAVSTVWVASNTFLNSIGGSFRTYGVYFDGLASGATIQNNGFYYRTPGATAGGNYVSGIFIQNSAGIVISRNRISNPGMVTGLVLGVGLTSTPNTVFTFNDVHSTGTAIDSAYHLRLTGAPNTFVYGNVFSSSWTAIGGSTASLYVDNASKPGFRCDYNDFFSSNSFNSIEWGNAPTVGVAYPWNAVTGSDGNSVAKHPRWKDVSPGVEDFHHLSQAGRWNGTAFVNDGWTSGLLDAGDPLDPVGAEQAPNGSRINIGSYGGTAEASRSPERAGAPAVAGVFTSSVSISYGLTTTASNGYIMIASTASNFSGTVLASTTANNALAALAPQGLSANTTYFFAAGAVWGDFYSFNLAAVSTATLALAPAAGGAAFSNVELSSLTVSWLPNGNPVDVATYSVVLTTGASFPNAFAGNIAISTIPAGAAPTATQPAGLSANTTYFAFAAAVNWNGAPSAYTALGSTATLAAAPLTAVSTFAGVGYSSFSVAWNPNGNSLAVTTYTVTVSTASDFNAFASSVSFSTVPAVGAGATFTGLSANTEYFFRVRAINRNGVPTAYAVLGSTETRPVSLQAPAIAGIRAVYASSITATWGLTPLATGYTLVASLINDPTAVAASSAPVGINATTATVFAPALSPNTTYFLFVRATGPGAQTAFSAFPATATLAAAPATAVSTFSSVLTTSMTVSWLPGGNPVGVTSYTVVLSTGSSYPNAFTGNRTLSTAPAGAGPAATFTALLDNTEYFAFVAAVNHNGVPSAYAALGSTVTLIAAPTSVVFDEISSNTIVASAYAPAPMFSNLDRGLSGTRISVNTVYSPFHGEQWVSTTSMSTARREAAAAVFNGKIYVFGGFNGAALGTVERYDPATASWTPMPAMTARRAAAATLAGGRIYVAGGTSNGFTSLAVNEEFDPAVDAWGAAKTAMPTARDRLSAVSVSGSMYAFAGETDAVVTGVNEKYEPAANAWTAMAAYPAGRRQIAAAAAAGPMSQTIIAAGGSGAVASVFAYNSVLNTWTAKASMPAGLASGAAASLGGKIYVVGGSPALRSVYEYDPATDLWTTRAAMPTGRAEMSVVAAAGRIYAVGGTSDGGTTPLALSEMYDPGVSTVFTGLTPNTPAGFQAQARNQAGVWSDESVTVATWTWAALPAAVGSPFTVVEKDSVTVAWASNGNPAGTEFKARASTAASFGGGAAILSSDWGAMNSTSTLTLTPNTTYFFQSKARNGVGGAPGIETAFVALGSTSTLAAVPAAAVPFALAGTNGLTVSWLGNGNPLSITTYTVVVSTEAVYPNSNTGNVVLSTFPAGALPTASLSGLVANTTYFAFASAVNHNGVRTAYAALGSTATLTLPPAAASPAFAAVSTAALTFSWLPNGNPVNVTTYSVVLSTGASFNSFAGNVGFSTAPAGALPSATASSGLSPNTTYFAYAAALNWNGAVSAYAALGTTATWAAAPATVASTFTSVHISSLTVSWSAEGNPLAFTTYTVVLSTASDFNAFASSFTFSTAPAAGPSATFTGLADFTQYFFRVRAVNHRGVATAYTALGSTTTLIAPLDPPALAGFPSVDITSITATWGLVPGATGYTFVASLSPADPPVAAAASSTTFSIAATTAAAYLPALSPNTTYFLFVRANGPLRSSPYAAYGATSTLSSPPATVASTFTGVGITSFTVSWSANGNALAITTYTVQLSTASDFNAFATSVTYTTAPVFGPSAMLTGLSGNTSYYLRVRSINNNGVPSAFVSLGSTLTVASPLFPTILNSQTGDAVWRRANNALYDVAFLDTSGAHLDKFEVKASTTQGGLGTDIAPWTPVIVGLLPADTYSTPWSLPASVFNSLLEGVTNYISVRAFNGPPLNNFTVLQDAFFVRKDTTSPVFVNTQAGDSVPRAAPGTTYTVGVRDPSSGLAAFQYSASLTPGAANASVIGWTDIAVVANTTSYSTPWTVNFPALVSGVTNYISVRSWDTAGATTTLTDAFFVHKDTTGPSVAIAAPQTGSFYSALATLSGTAASIYGVRGTEVSILDVLSGLYWNPASAAFNSAAPVMIAATGGTAWSLAPGIPWVDGAAYRAVARSSTTAGLYSTTYATSTFVMDLSKPSVGGLAPAPDSTVSVLPQISGTASDPAPNPSGLSSVEVRLRRNSDGLWWNWFAQSWGPVAVSSITAGTTAWSLSPTPQLKSSLAHGASYFIAVRASDNALPANQGDFFVSGATFTWQDTAPPSAVANLAAVHGAAPGSIDLSWTAPGDDAGAGAILLGEYRIFYSTDVAAVASTAAAQVVVSTAGVNPGDLQSYTLSGLTPGVTYFIRLALADSDFNWSAFSNQASTEAMPSPLNAITGHVTDVSTQGITAVQVDCWNASGALVGTTFTLADGSGSFTVGSLPAGSYKLRVTWTVNGFSSSLWQDGITMGATNVDFVLEINYALATLTGTLGTLTASSFGTGGLGTASVSESFIELYQQGRQVARTTVKPTGRWSIPGLLPGAYSVRAFTGLGYTPFQEVTLVEGEVRVLGFVFNPLPEASVFAFPNPARASTTIRFETALAPLEAGISIFDLAGNLVKEIPDSQISRAAAPVYRVAWDLNNSSGRPVAPGVYHVMVKVKGGSEDQTAKVIKKLAVVR